MMTLTQPTRLFTQTTVSATGIQFGPATKPQTRNLTVYNCSFISRTLAGEEYILIFQDNTTTANITYSSFKLIPMPAPHHNITHVISVILKSSDPNATELPGLVAVTNNWFGSPDGPTSCCTSSSSPILISLGVDFSRWSLVCINRT